MTLTNFLVQNLSVEETEKIKYKWVRKFKLWLMMWKYILAKKVRENWRHVLILDWGLGWEEGFQQRGPAVIPSRWLDFVVTSIVVEVNEEEGSEQGGFGGRLKGGREGQTELVF